MPGNVAVPAFEAQAGQQPVRGTGAVRGEPLFAGQAGVEAMQVTEGQVALMPRTMDRVVAAPAGRGKGLPS